MLHTSFANTGAASAVAILAADAAVRYRVWRIEVSTSGAAVVSVHEGTDGASTRYFFGNLTVGPASVVDFTGQGGQLLSAKNVALNVTTDAANVAGVVYYTKGE